jgi:cyclophilin family peptidyl-prolyl cis-trans isomerase
MSRTLPLFARTAIGALILLAGSLPWAATLADKPPQVALKTSMGQIVLELDAAKAPVSVSNFLGYVKDGFFDGTIFHRVIDGFMIQGGGFDKDFNKKNVKDAIRNEAANGLKNVRGSIALARPGDPHSATAQFFINVADNDFLNHTAPSGRGWGYAVFGRVVEGMEVVDAIKAVATGRRGSYTDVPREDVVILSATILGE